MKNRNITIGFLLLNFLLSAKSFSQVQLSLQECLKIAINNNLQLKSAQNRQSIAKEAITENRAKLLPQLNGFASFNDNFEPPVSATDQSANGSPYHITQTLQYSAGMGIQLNATIYNQTLITSMKLVKQAHQLSIFHKQKTHDDIIINTAKIYFMAQVTKEQITLLEDNIQSLTELRAHTASFHENGMALEIDVLRVDLNLSKLKTAKDNALLILQQQYNTLKYIMDYPAEDSIEVISADIHNLQQAENIGISNDLPELLILRQQREISKTQLKISKQEYIPTLSLTGFLQWNAWTGDLGRWKNGFPDNKLWDSYGIGITLHVPIFDGFNKSSKIRKHKLEVNNSEIQINDMQRNIETQYINAINQRENALQTYQREKDSYELAQTVYRITSDQYTEGIASMTSVLQDQMNINQALSEYLKAYLDYRLADLTIIKLSGQINNLLK